MAFNLAIGPRVRNTKSRCDGGRMVSNKHPWDVMLEGRSVGMLTAAAYSLKLERNIAIAPIERPAAESDRELVVHTVDGPRQAQVTGVPFC